MQPPDLNNLMLDALPIGTVLLNADMTICAWNRTMEDWTGVSREGLLGRPLTEAFPHLAGVRYAGRIQSLYEGGAPVIFSAQLHPHIFSCPLPAGCLRILQTTVTRVFVDESPFALVSVQDFTDLVLAARESRRLHQHSLDEIEYRKQIELALKESAERIRAIVDNAVEGIIVINGACQIEEFNPAAEKIFGYQAAEVIGKDVSMLMPDPYRSEHAGYVSHYLETNSSRLIGRDRDFTGRRRDGSVFPLHISVSETSVQGHTLFVGIVQDISVRKQLEEHLRTLSFKDGLTGCNNRRAFDENLAKEWRRARRNDMPLALVMLDIDCFKAFNDTYGHQEGDSCLREVARVIMANLKRPADFAARYGGEEFVLLLPETSLENALALAETIRLAVAALEIPHQQSDVAAYVTLSAGMACLVPGEEQSADDLMKLADQALYAAKKAGRNRVCLG